MIQFGGGKRRDFGAGPVGMNAIPPVRATEATLIRKVQLVGLLERICQCFEPTDTQYEQAGDRYGAVGRWLDECDHVLFDAASIYPQGSFAIGTAKCSSFIAGTFGSIAATVSPVPIPWPAR